MRLGNNNKKLFKIFFSGSRQTLSIHTLLDKKTKFTLNTHQNAVQFIR